MDATLKQTSAKTQPRAAFGKSAAPSDALPNLFIGIDLGGKEKQTTGLCVLRQHTRERCQPVLRGRCRTVKGKTIFDAIKPYLANTAAVAIDAPLTKGKGKGQMRLWEKFLSTRIFRQ